MEKMNSKDRLWGIGEIVPGRKEGELNREMFQIVGIKPGTPSRSPLDTHFVSDGKEWTICTSGSDDKLIITKKKRENVVTFARNVTIQIILYGKSFHSTFHVSQEGFVQTVFIINKAKSTMEDELLELFSRPSLEPKEVDRISALLHVGINPNCTNTDGEAPLILCMKIQEGELRLKTLTTMLEGNKSRYEGSLPKKVDLNVKDRQQKAAFELLMEKQDNDPRVYYESLKILVHGGFDIINWKSKSDHNALHLLCLNYKHENIIDAMKLLIDNGIDVKWKGAVDGRTPLHFLCTSYKNENIIDVMELIEKGVDVTSADNYGVTALHVLCIQYQNENFVEAMELLIGKGVDVKLKDQRGHTALHYLCQYYKNENIVDAMKILIDNGVEVNLKDKDGRTALHLLCENYKNDNIVEAMKLLIAEKDVLDVNLTDTNRRTALHYLCIHYRKANIDEAMNFLIDKGVHVDLKDEDKKTALDYLHKPINMATRKRKYGHRQQKFSTADKPIRKKK